MKNADYRKARKFSNTFRFIDDLVAINDGNEFLKCFQEIYPPELELKKENITNTEATFLDLHLSIRNGAFITKLYDKRVSYNFNIVRFPYKCSTLPSKMFFSTISAEILRICRANSSLETFLETSQTLTLRMRKQGADNFGLKSVLRKMINRHLDDFIKYDIHTNDLIKTLLT